MTDTTTDDTTDSRTDDTTEAEHDQLAAAFGRDRDPLAQYAPTFDAQPVDPFAMFIDDVVRPDDPADDTLTEYRRTFSQWRDHMATVDAGAGRHPCCPSTAHVKSFIRDELHTKGNAVTTVKSKITALNAAYTYWQREASFPHGQDFNPFETAREKIAWGDPDHKDPRPLTLKTLRERLQAVKHVRDRAVIACGLKLGLRAGEVRNIQLQDLALSDSDLNAHYDDMGSHPRLRGHENTIIIPSNRERDGNKSSRPRLLPLDEEMRRALRRYMLVRPDAPGEPWLFLTEDQHTRIQARDGVNRLWKAAFPRDEYGETEEFKPVTSHYGRHAFSTHWRVDQDMPRELVQYMRGDKTGRQYNREAIDTYLHAYYQDIEEAYRADMFWLGL